MKRIAMVVGLTSVFLFFGVIITARWTGASDLLDRFLGKNYLWSVAHAQHSDLPSQGEFTEYARWDHRAIRCSSTGEYNQWIAEHEELLDSGQIQVYERHVSLAYAMIPASFTTALEKREVYAITVFYKKLRQAEEEK